MTMMYPTATYAATAKTALRYVGNPLLEYQGISAEVVQFCIFYRFLVTIDDRDIGGKTIPFSYSSMKLSLTRLENGNSRHLCIEYQ